MARSPRMPRVGWTTSQWPLAAGPTACALPLAEDLEVAAAGRVGSLVTSVAPAVGAASTYRAAAACAASSLGTGGKAGVGTLCPRAALLRGRASQPSSLSVCKRRRGERPRGCGPLTLTSPGQTPCSRAVLPALRARLSAAGGCCPVPRAGWGDGCSMRGCPPRLGSTPGMPVQPAGHSTGVSACWGAGRTVPSSACRLPIGTSQGRGGGRPCLPQGPYLCATAARALSAGREGERWQLVPVEGRGCGPAALPLGLGLPAEHLWGGGGGAGWRPLRPHSDPRGAGKPGPGFKAAPGHYSQGELGSALLSASGPWLRGCAGHDPPTAGPAPHRPLAAQHGCAQAAGAQGWLSRPRLSLCPAARLPLEPRPSPAGPPAGCAAPGWAGSECSPPASRASLGSCAGHLQRAPRGDAAS